MEAITRQSYIDKIEKHLGKETIIVLVGQRRVGKSYTLKMMRDRKAADETNNIIYIDKEKWGSCKQEKSTSYAPSQVASASMCKPPTSLPTRRHESESLTTYASSRTTTPSMSSP